MSFEGKVALVTGAGSGIGRASALGFAELGARVVVADIDEEGGRETVALAGGDDRAMFVRTDVTQDGEVRRLVEQTIERFGRLDAAHNNAGAALVGPRLHEITEEQWEQQHQVNLKSIWLCLKYEVDHMRSHGGGAIVNTASSLGIAGLANQAGYVATKHGVVGLTKAASLDYAADGIRVNAICPGLTRSPMMDYAMRENPEVLRPTLEAHPLGRMGEPAEQAAAVTWLCSDAASFVTGAVMPVDGGFVVSPI